MKKQIWIGFVHVTPGDVGDSWRDAFGDADGGYAWALANATDAEDFERSILENITASGWQVGSFDDVSTFEASFEAQRPPAEIKSARRRLRSTGVPQFTDFHLYRRPDYSPSSRWAGQLEGLSELQAEVARNIQDMVNELDLPFLEGINVSREGEEVEIVLINSDEQSVDLAVRVENDQAVTVDYSISHIHFTDGEDDWLDMPLTFIASALQGGVKVDICTKGNEVAAARTYLLEADGSWDEWSTSIYHHSLKPDKLSGREPDDSLILTFQSG